jgi:ectoine hydroxylase-related dioxygenase (phytanoyl-CoA dioxygenase family)
MPQFTPDNREFFDANGYVVIPNAVPLPLCEAVIDTLFSFLRMDPDNPEDWYRLPLKPGGMIEIYQHQALWNTRQYPGLHAIFTELYGTEKLTVTIDRAGFKPPRHPDHPEYDHKGFTHWDVDTSNLPNRFGAQAVLCLADTDSDMGGFQCIPGFHKNLPEWIATQPADRNPRMPDLTGLTVVPIPAKAGSIIIWNNLLAHGNGHNVSNKPRFSQYVSMYPADRMSDEVREQRIAQWRNHTPPYNSVFPGDPRRIEEEEGVTAELTPLGRKLLGVDRW